MKELRSLERMLRFFSAVHVVLLAQCLSLPLLFVVTEYPDRIQLLWALGGALPVLAIYALSLHLKKRLLRLLACLTVLAVSLLICQTTLLRVIYSVMIALECLICVVLPWPDGRPALSSPRFYHALAFLMLYAFSLIMEHEVMRWAAIVIAMLFVLDLLLHYNTERLRDALCEADATLSDRRIVRTNRRLILLFAVLGTALIVLVPLLFARGSESAPQPEEPVYGELEEDRSQATEPAPTENPIYMDHGNPIDINTLLHIALSVVYFFLFAGFGLIVWSWIQWLRALRQDKKKHSPPPEDEGFVVEALPAQEAKPRESRLARDEHGWSRRIRRQYERLIRARAGGASLAALSPDELEDAAALHPCPARQTLHGLYEQARYAGEACTKQDYQTARAAAQQLRKGDETA